MAEVKFGIAQLNQPTPRIWGRLSTSLRYFLVGAITTLSGTDLFPAPKIKVITMIMGGLILLLKAIDMGLGVQPENPPPSNN